MSQHDPRPLRLGVICAVIHNGHLLLSRRGDLNVWTLPGGRLEAGERLANSAVREVYEETGLTVQIEQPIGLYYLAGWQRMNLLFLAKPQGGTLRKTDETRDNRFFPIDSLPAMPLAIIADDAVQYATLSMRPLPHVIAFSSGEMRTLKLRLGLRYVVNALRGRPEPKFPHFDVGAVAAIWNKGVHRVLTLPGTNDLRTLPRIACDGENPVWEQLATSIEERTGLKVTLQWVGVWQDTRRNRLEFVFGAVIPNGELFRAGEWSSPRNTVFDDLDAEYIMRVKPNFASEPVWTLDHVEPTMQAGNTIIRVNG
jgi:ADP-ribose pyrophosphatase YjhB (NUDIX family)